MLFFIIVVIIFVIIWKSYDSMSFTITDSFPSFLLLLLWCMIQHTKSGSSPKKNCTRSLYEFENVQGESSNEDQVGCSLCGCTFADDVETDW